MARFRTKTISRRTVEALKVEKDTVFWDRELRGFGVRVYQERDAGERPHFDTKFVAFEPPGAEPAG